MIPIIMGQIQCAGKIDIGQLKVKVGIAGQDVCTQGPHHPTTHVQANPIHINPIDIAGKQIAFHPVKYQWIYASHNKAIVVICKDVAQDLVPSEVII